MELIIVLTIGLIVGLGIGFWRGWKFPFIYPTNWKDFKIFVRDYLWCFQYDEAVPKYKNDTEK